MTIFLKKFRSKVFKKNKENQEERRVNKRGCSNKKNINKEDSKLIIE
jgi:hypothetical protein